MTLTDPPAGIAGGLFGPGAASSTVAALERLRDEYQVRSGALHAAVDELAVAETGTAREFAVARAKIAGSGLPTAPRVAPVLRARLRQADGSARHGRWRAAAAGYAAVQESVTAARQRALGMRLDAAGLLLRRDELRDRLEACLMRAAAAGVDDGLAARHEQARWLLDTTPCDLRGGTRAVHAYEAALMAACRRHVPRRAG